MRGLIEDHGAPLPPQGLQMGPAVFLVHGEKSLKGKAPGGQAGGCQGGHQGAGTRNGHHIHPLFSAQSHQFLTGITDGRGARVGDQGAALPGQQAVQNRLPPASVL